MGFSNKWDQRSLETVDSRAGAGKYKMILNISRCQKVKKCSKYNEIIAKGLRIQLERDPQGKLNNLNKIIKVIDYSP